VESISLGGCSVPGFSLSAAKMTYEDALNTAASTSSLEPVDVYGRASDSDLTDAQLSAPLGNVLSGCGVPDNMRVTVSVAVKLGRAAGVTVVTDPPNSSVAFCVDRAVRRLRWPTSPKLDSLVTRF
jgi:hypothetical protein